MLKLEESFGTLELRHTHEVIFSLGQVLPGCHPLPDWRQPPSKQTVKLEEETLARRPRHRVCIYGRQTENGDDTMLEACAIDCHGLHARQSSTNAATYLRRKEECQKITARAW